MQFPQIMMPYIILVIITLLFIQNNGTNSDDVKVSKEQIITTNFFSNSLSRRQKRFEPITTALGIGAVAALYHGVKWWKRRNRKKKYRQNYQRMDTMQRWQMQENNGRRMGGSRRRTTSLYQSGPPISMMKDEISMPPPQMNGGGNSGNGAMPKMGGGANGGGGVVPMPPPQVKNDGMVPASMPNYDPIMIAKLAQKYAEYTSASDKLKYLADEAQKKLATFQKDLEIQLEKNFEGHPIPYPLSGQDTLNLLEMIELVKSCIFAGTLAVPIIEKVKKADPNTKHIISQKLAESLVTAIMDPLMQEKDKFEAKNKVAEKIATEIGP